MRSLIYGGVGIKSAGIKSEDGITNLTSSSSDAEARDNVGFRIILNDSGKLHLNYERTSKDVIIK